MQLLHRADFSLGPISYDLVEPRLYLGGLSAARDATTLQRCRITHILTIDTCPLPRQTLDLGRISFKFIQLSDQPREDLLSHLDDTFAFIDGALEAGGAVLVHCYFGVSRSATVVIAYMMRKHELDFADALKRVKARRSIVYPNEGFVAQLKLYGDLGCRLDKANTRYKMYRLNMAAHRVRRVKMLPHDFLDLVRPDPGVTQTQPEPNVIRCRKCRRVLATESNVLPHQAKGSPKDAKGRCAQTIFVEPLAWMEGVAQSTLGKLHCPKCAAKVGSFQWSAGCQCPCGVQVAPAFYLTPSKVDHANVVKNVELTF